MGTAEPHLKDQITHKHSQNSWRIVLLKKLKVEEKDSGVLCFQNKPYSCAHLTVATLSKPLHHTS